jgi:hypothetical protein
MRYWNLQVYYMWMALYATVSRPHPKMALGRGLLQVWILPRLETLQASFDPGCCCDSL